MNVNPLRVPDCRALLRGAGMLLAAGWLAAPDLAAQAGPGGPPSGQPKCGAKALQIHEANLARHKSAPDMLVLPGLVADRKAKRVELLAESTGLAGNGVAEFLLVDQSSSHGYEALLWSMARPSDVDAALVFIGMPQGAAYDPAQLRLWPKGERVNVSLAVTNGAAGTALLPIENLILDRKTERALPEEGFMFTASSRLPAPDGGTGTVYAADAYDPKAVVSLYNDPGTVLDVPRQANQGDVYNTQVVNPEHVLAAGELLTIVLEPQRKDGARRVQDLVLEIGVSPAGTNKAGRAFRFALKDARGTTLTRAATLEGVADALKELLGKGADAYVAVRFDGALTLPELRRLSAVVGMLEAGSGIRIEPPPQGHVYYKAFLPDERWREASSRIAQPWELHLSRDQGAVKGRLVLNEEIWSDDSPDPTLKPVSFEVATPGALRAQLDADAEQRKLAKKRPALTVLLVFAGADLTYGELMHFIVPALTTHKTVHVFGPAGS